MVVLLEAIFLFQKLNALTAYFSSAQSVVKVNVYYARVVIICILGAVCRIVPTATIKVRTFVKIVEMVVLFVMTEFSVSAVLHLI